MKNFAKIARRGLATVTKYMMLAVFMAAPLLTTAGPVVTPVAAAEQRNCNPTFLGIPPWYRGLTEGEDCTLKSPDDLSSFIWTIVLNVIEMALVATAYIAAGFIMYGGFIWLTGGSQPAQVAKGRKTILNAVIGLVIAMGAIALNNLIFSNLVK